MNITVIFCEKDVMMVNDVIKKGGKVLKKVVLLAINSKYLHSSLSVWLLAGGIKKYARRQYDVNIFESTIHIPKDEIAGKVAAFKPDVVGISAYIWNSSILPGLISALQEKLPMAKIVLGGPEVLENAELEALPGVCHVISGEGEFTFASLLDKMTDGNDSPISPCNENIYPCGEPIDPYDGEYFKALNGRIAYIETSRGCPFKCKFCLSGSVSQRFFPLDTAKEWIYKLSKSDARTIKFVDRTFNCNASRAAEIFEYVIGLDTDRCFHFEVAADLFDSRTLEILKQAQPGRIQLEAGLQSFFEPTLEAVSRKMDIKKAEHNLKALINAGNIHTHVDLIAGLPYETLEEFKVSFDKAYSLRAHTLQLGFLKFLHGSEMRRKAKGWGMVYSPAPPYEILSSPWLSEDDLRVLKITENALQHTYNKGRFLLTLEYVLSATGLRPFSLMNTIGDAAPNHGTQLEKYAEQLFECLAKLENVDEVELCDKMTCDWLSMVKGKNMPEFMKNSDPKREKITQEARAMMNHEIGRSEIAVLRSGIGVFVDNSCRDPVTGLYKLHLVEL